MLAANVWAQERGAEASKSFPTKPIRIVVPFEPGGGNDVMGRFIGRKLTERMGQPSVIDNRPGAGGSIGAELAAKSPPDGYTLLIISSSYAMNAAIQKLAFDPVRALVPISQIGSGASVLITSPSLPVSSIKELIALAKAHPGKLNYSSAGIGGTNHFAGELFKLATGTDIVHVPFKGGSPATMAVMGGQIEMTFQSLIGALPHVRSGKVRALGIGSAKRSPALPDTPAIAETVPGFEAVFWWGVLGPAGIPPAIVSKLNAEIGAILSEPETTKRFAAEAAEAVVASPAAFGKVVADEIMLWKRVAKASGITAQ